MDFESNGNVQQKQQPLGGNQQGYGVNGINQPLGNPIGGNQQPIGVNLNGVTSLITIL